MRKMKLYFISCLVALIFLGQFTNVNAENIENDSQKEEYYSETIYYEGEKLKEIQPFHADSDESVLVGAVEKVAYISETKNDEGVVIESHLMNAKEVEEYKKSQLTRDSTHMGDDKASQGRLEILIQVFREENKYYRAYGTATWLLGDGGDINGQSSGYDFVAITWGGNNDLVQTSKNIHGTNHDGSSISFGQAKADSYKGYCWSFNESFPNFMKSLQAQVQIKRVSDSLKNKQTSMKFTYIHTYQSTTGSITLQANSSGLAASVPLSGTTNKWQIEADVPGVTY